jgi:propanol-preferring alcohol dehydrogenase
MSDTPGFPYADLWEERRIVSVANLTRSDGISFFEAAEQAQVHTVTESHPLEAANLALEGLRSGKVVGTAVLVPGSPIIKA